MYSLLDEYRYMIPKRMYETTIHEIFSFNVKNLREKLDLSQSDLAVRAGLSLGYIAQIETGRKYPSADVLDKLAAALEVRPFRLYMNNQDLVELFKDKDFYSKQLAESMVAEFRRITEHKL